LGDSEGGGHGLTWSYLWKNRLSNKNQKQQQKPGWFKPKISEGPGPWKVSNVEHCLFVELKLYNVITYIIGKTGGGGWGKLRATACPSLEAHLLAAVLIK